MLQNQAQSHTAHEGILVLMVDQAHSMRASLPAQREVQEVLMRMFPYTAARVKADIQRAACTDIGMHMPALWQKVAVSVTTSVLYGIPHASLDCCTQLHSCLIAVASLQPYPRSIQSHRMNKQHNVQRSVIDMLSQSKYSVPIRVMMSILASTGRCTAQSGTEGALDQLAGRATAEYRQNRDREAPRDEQHQGKSLCCIAHAASWDMSFASGAFCAPSQLHFEHPVMHYSSLHRAAYTVEPTTAVQRVSKVDGQ